MFSMPHKEDSLVFSADGEFMNDISLFYFWSAMQIDKFGADAFLTLINYVSATI